MASHRLFQITLCCLFLAPLVGAAMPADAAPPPRPLCDACGESFEETAATHGVMLTVERSTASVSVHDNGSATWVVQNQLADSSDVTRLRTNASLRADIADRAMWDTEFLDANVSDNGTITMRYREAEFAEQSVGGAFQSGAFTERYGYRNLDGLGADRLEVTAPEGTTIGWAVSGATVSDDGRRMTLTEFDEGRVVTFVPDNTLIGPLLSFVVVGSLVGPVMAIQALAYITLPAAVFTLFVGAIAGGLSWLDRDFEMIHDSPGISLAGIGAFVTGLSILAVGSGLLRGGSAATLFGSGLAFVLLGTILSRPSVRAHVTYRWLVSGAVIGALTAVGVAITGASLFGQNGVTLLLLTTLPFLGPVFTLLPTGYALGRGNRRLAITTAALGFVLAMLPLLPILPSPFGLGLLFVFIATGYAAIIAVVGVPLLIVGASLAPGRSPADLPDTAVKA